jgi:hypothetical protein
MNEMITDPVQDDICGASEQKKSGQTARGCFAAQH